MRKRLLVFLMMVLSTFLGFVSCDKDLYAGLTIALVEDKTIQLFIEETTNNVGATIYKCDPVTFDVEVQCDDKNISKEIVIGDGGGYVDATVEYVGDGVSRVSVYALSKDYTGNYALKLFTKDGKKPLKVNINIDFKINDFEFDTESSELKAVVRGGVIDLTNLSEIIKFYPNETTQTNLKFDVVVPNSSGRIDSDDEDVYNKSYIYNVPTSSNDYGAYAKIVDNKTLVTNKTYIDEYGDEQLVTYPKIDKGFADSEGVENDTEQCVILKATYSDDDPETEDIVDYIDIVVVEECKDVNLKMNSMVSMAGESEFVLNKTDDNLVYDVVLVDPNMESAIDSTEINYFTERTLRFDLGEVDDFGYDPEDYEVVSCYNGVDNQDVTIDHNECVEISSISGRRAFKVVYRQDGSYSHTFVLRHKKYPESVRKEIKVNFITYSLPSDIFVNNTYDNKTFVVCDNYPIRSAEFKITLGSNAEVLANKFADMKYFVAVNNFNNFEEDIVDLSNNLILNRPNEERGLTLFNVSEENSVTAPLNQTATKFSNNSTFMLKHNFTAIPNPKAKIYVVVEVDLCPDSYSQTIVKDYFEPKYKLFAIDIELVHSLQTFGFEYSKYYLDQTAVNSEGVYLFTLNPGQTLETMIASMSYDESLIDIYTQIFDKEGVRLPDETKVTTEHVVKVFAKSKGKLGKTKLNVVAKNNGLSETVDLEVFRPSSYIGADGLYNGMPLGARVVSDESTYLEYINNCAITENGEIEPSLKYEQDIYKGNVPDGVDNVLGIDSLSKLIMNVGKTAKLEFYDYAFVGDELHSFDITDDCIVTVNGYKARYENGYLTAKTLATDMETPLKLRVLYNAKTLDEYGQLIAVDVIKEIDLYFYNDISGVKLTVPNKAEIYLWDLLSDYDKYTNARQIGDTELYYTKDEEGKWVEDRCEHYLNNYYSNNSFYMMDNNFDSLSYNMGDCWNCYYINSRGELIYVYTTGGSTQYSHVSVDYNYGLSGNIVVDNENVALNIDGENYYLEYKDLFSGVQGLFSDDDSTCTYCKGTCGDSVFDKYGHGDKNKGAIISTVERPSSGRNENEKGESLKTKLFELLTGDGVSELDPQDINLPSTQLAKYDGKIKLVIPVYVNQFNNRRLLNYIEITLRIPKRVDGFDLQVQEDGVYFDSRDGVTYQDIPYILLNNDATNKEMVIVEGEQADWYKAEVISKGNYGYIRIKTEPGKLKGRSSQIKIVPRDIIKYSDPDGDGKYEMVFDENGQIVLNSSTENLVKTFRVHCSDGSEVYPFEIRDVNDFKSMINDIKSKNYYHYVLTRDLDLSGYYDYEPINFDELASEQFSLSGRHHYVTSGYLNNRENIVEVYRTIYNLKITKTIDNFSDDVNIGLFGKVGNNVTLKDVSIKNAIIELEVGNKVAGTNPTINVGILLGSTYKHGSCNVSNCSVSGIIKVSSVSDKFADYKINIGGMAGSFAGEIGGMPRGAVSGLTSTSDNANVSINANELNANNSEVTIGGLIGTLNSDLSDMQVVSNIRTRVGGNVGGAIGKLNSGKVSNLVVSPKIYFENENVSTFESNIGGIVGSSNGLIEKSKVYFVNVGKEYGWKEKVNIYANTPKGEVFVGGIAGKTTSSIKYTYVRSFYTSDISENYIGNIYVNSLSASSKIGGVSAVLNGGLVSSYFEGDIVCSNNINVGLLFVDGNPSEVTNSYSIAKVYNNQLSEINTVNVMGINATTLSNVYAILNEKQFYVTTNAGTLSDVNITDFNEQLNTFGLYQEVGGNDYNWYKSDDIHTIEYNNANYGLPILIVKNGETYDVLYDLVPSGISVNINANADYNISYNGKTQLILFSDKYYDIKYDDETASINVILENNIISTFKISANDKIEISEEMVENRDVINIVGNRVYPIAEGVAKVIINSYLNKDVKIEILIKVVKSFDTFDIYNADSGDGLFAKDENGEFKNKFGVVDSENLEDIYLNEKYNFQIVTNNNTIVNSSVGYIIEKISGNGIFVNNVDLNVANSYVLSTDGKIQVYSNTKSKVGIKVRPYIILDDVNNYSCQINGENVNNVYILDGFEKTYYFECRGRATSISVDTKSIELSPKDNLNIVVNLTTPNIEEGKVTDVLQIAFRDEVVEIDNISATDIGVRGIDIEILNFAIVGFDYSEIEGTSLYNVNVTLNLTFDEGYYNQNANIYDLNIISYDLYFKVDTNEKISDNTHISIVPNKISKFYIDYYPRTSRDEENNNLIISDFHSTISNSAVPGTDGLLQITPDQKINNSSYVVVLLEKKYIDYVTIEQMSGVVGNLDEIVGYQSLGDSEDYEDYKHLFANLTDYDNYFGIKLSKLSINRNNNSYFNNTYYVKLNLKESCNNLIGSSIPVRVVSGDKTNLDEFVDNKIDLTLKRLPKISVSVEGKRDIDKMVIGRGVKKELDIKFDYLYSDISFDILDNDNSEYVYLAYEENGALIKAYNTISIEKLNSGIKYYLCVDVASSLNSFNVVFEASEIILGMIETTRFTLPMSIVNYEIDKIEISNANPVANDENNLYIEINHSNKFKFEVNVVFKDIVIGDSGAIEGYKKELNKYSSNINQIGYELSGEYFDIGANKFGLSVLNYLDYLNEDRSFNSKVSISNTGVNTYGGIKILIDENAEFELCDDEECNCDDGINGCDKYNLTTGKCEHDHSQIFHSQYNLAGLNISESNKFKLSFEYYYQGGDIVIYNDEQGDIVRQAYDIYIDIKVKDNSTYDHPNPIETEQDLINACNSDGTSYYILVNNIELNNWKPIDVKCLSIDGNGYRIIVNSFNFSNIKESSTVNCGIFSTVSENTLLKNITVDISRLLVSEDQVNDDVRLVGNSTKENYKPSGGATIDLAFTKTVNFGILAGENSGSITNAKVINTFDTYDSKNLYLHILTTQDSDNSEYVSNIAGLVGVNKETGTITNSYIGKTAHNGGGVKLVKNPSETLYDNSGDSLDNFSVYPFVIVGGNNISGLVSINEGIIGNSYSKALGLYNVYPLVNGSTTSGLVGENEGRIYSSFVESDKKTGFRPLQDTFVLETKGSLSGVVFTNNGLVENSYSDVYIETQGAFSGGFVFTNNGTIKNAYSTINTRNSIAHGQFIGIIDEEIQNYGTMENCYIINDGSGVNISEGVKVLNASNEENTGLNSRETWYGFVFEYTTGQDGIWSLTSGKYELPKVTTSLIETISFRQLVGINDFENNVAYNYDYVDYELGTEYNPLVIENAKNFITYIIDNAVEVVVDIKGTEDVIDDDVKTKVFGLNSTQYVRLVNNLDFKDTATSISHDGYHLYEIVFAGILEGNGMRFDNLNIQTGESDEERILDDFGLFAQIGYKGCNAVIKNISIDLSVFATTDRSRAGVLAGTIVDATIVNVDINGNHTISNGTNVIEISANNAAGGLAGLIKSESRPVKINDITISNIAISASRESAGNIESQKDKVNKDGKYREFLDGSQTISYATLYNENIDGSKSDLSKINEVSYAGGFAGVLIIPEDSNAKSNSEVYDITVKGGFNISNSDNAGGIVGYLSNNSRISEVKFELADNNQLIKGRNFVGGIVGESYGIINKAVIEYAQEQQKEIDNSIESNNRITGTYNLFKTDIKTVSVGGIAGYIKNGTISNSYAKVNVINNLGFIAGGIVGYAEDKVVLNTVYTTGAVYSAEIIGGVIGVQYHSNNDENLNNDENNKVELKNVVALNDWNNTGNDDTVNFRNEITKRLYNNAKYVYQNGANILNFYIKMPEVGNLQPTRHTSNPTSNSEYDNLYISADENILNNYCKDSEKYFTGSVVGRLIFESDEPGTPYDKIVDYDSVKSFYISENVFSSTMGTFKRNSSGNNKVDDYTSQTFNLDIGESKLKAIYSYRIAYDSKLNPYQNKSNMYDYFSYKKIFKSQEYAQQLIGSSWVKSGDKYLQTKNVFKFEIGNDDDSLDSRLFHAGVDNISYDGCFSGEIWDLSSRLPSLIIEDKNVEKLNELTVNIISESKTYSVDKGLQLEISSPIDSWSVSLLGVGSETKKQKVTLTMSGNYINKITEGVRLDNLHIILDYSSISEFNSNAIFDFGLFANHVNNAQITNCTIEIKLPKKINISNVTNLAGLVFGNVKESNFTNTEIILSLSDVDSVEINAPNKFGLFAGQIDSTSMSNVTIKTNNITEVTIKNESENENYFGSFAIAKNSYINNLNISEISKIKVLCKSNSKIATMAGYLENSTINNVKIKSVLEISDSASDLKIVKDAYVGLLSGYMVNSSIKNIEVVKDSAITINNGMLGENLYLGGFVGYAISSTIGSKITQTGSNASISVIGFDNVYVGGAIGYVYGCNSISGTYNTGNISVSNSGKDGTNQYIGGLVGYINRRSTIDSVLSAGKITTAGMNGNIYVGGLIGATSSYSIAINNFSILTEYELNAKTYVAGIVANSQRDIVLTNGFVYSQVPSGENMYACANISSTKYLFDSVYYAQEFTVNYDMDCRFNTFALADLYSSDENSNINIYIDSYELISNNYMVANTVQKIKVLVPKVLNNILAIDFTNGAVGTKYNPNVLNNSNVTPIAGLNIIIENGVKLKIDENNSIISGRTMGIGQSVKVYHNVGGESGDIININNGVVSNVTFDLSCGTSNSYNIVAITMNNGLIIDVLVTGKTNKSDELNAYGFVETNYGNIYRCVSDYIYMGGTVEGGSEINLYTFALEDNNVSDDLSKSGKIKDCVSYSYAITNSENPVKVYVADKDNEIDRVRIVLPDAEDLVNVHTNMYNNYTLNLKNYNSIVWEEDGSLKGFKVAI